MGGLIPPPALVVIEIRVELGQADDREPPLRQRGVEDALVIRGEQVDVPLPLARPQP